MEDLGYNFDDLTLELLNCKPTEPLASDCCGNGCNLCVFDIYQQELKIWQNEVQKQFASRNNQSEKSSSVIEAQEYIKFKLIQIIPHSPECNIYRFEISGRRKLGANMGQHLIMRGIFNGETITRQYTPVSAIDAEGHFDVLIKLYEHGKMSNYIRQWQIGERVDWRGPFGHFQYESNSFRRIVMIAAGTGLTPFVQIIDRILEDETDETYVRLLFGCRYYDDILLKAKIDVWKGYWNFSVLYCLSQEQDQTRKKYGEEIFYGRINQSLLSQEMEHNRKGSLVLICGSNTFNSDISNYIKIIAVCDSFIF